MYPIVVSFVHGYQDLDINLPEVERPALWVIKDKSKKSYNYPFPRNPGDFFHHQEYISGEMPFHNAIDFKKLPRFGFTGLAQSKDYIFAGSWNAVYKIGKKDYKLGNIISNHLMNDLHGIYVDEDIIISILTSKDTVVISNHEGIVIDHFSVLNDLVVMKYDNIDETDWRFISKQFRGSTGYWHFNYVQRFEDEIWLTARNANAFVVVNTKTKKAHLRLMNFFTPVLLHDGKKKGDKYYFTSIDGKIIVAGRHTDSFTSKRENVGDLQLYNRDLVTEAIRLNETALGREPNWCRGIDVDNGVIYVNIDGRYGTDLSFRLLGLREEDHEILFDHRLKWSEIGSVEDLRFVTGFDVMVQK